jgi:hypothetical protein
MLGLLALGALLVAGGEAAPYGALVAAGEVRRAPAAVAAIALRVLLRGARALPAAAGWTVAGAAVSVAARAALGIAGENGWMPGEATSRPAAMIEAAWLVAIAGLAWRGLPARLAGPLLCAVVATTRIGAYGEVFVPLLWEDTVAQAAALGVAVGAGFAAGVMVVAMGGWMVSVLARIPERRVAPGRVLAVLALAAAAWRA